MITINKRDLKNLIKEHILKNKRENLIMELYLLENEELIKEGFFGKLAGILGIKLASLFSVFGQSGIDLQKLGPVYSPEEIEKLEMAMQDSTIQQKLKNAGAEDNNIANALKNLDKLKDAQRSKVVHKTVDNDKELARLLKNGYHLTSIDVDTLEQIVKDTGLPDVITVDTVRLDDNFFKSGFFVPNEQTVAAIKYEIDSIKSIPGSMIVGVTIESSTDKQGLSMNLQKALIGLGYEPNNKGLSAARNNGLKDVVLANGVDDSLINQIKLYEQGNDVIDQSARYVNVYISYYVLPAPPLFPEKGLELKNTYELFKVISSGKPKPISHKGDICKKNFEWNKKLRTKTDKIVDCPWQKQTK